MAAAVMVVVVIAMDGLFDQLDALVFVVVSPGHGPNNVLFLVDVVFLLLLILSEIATRFSLKVLYLPI